jgi:RND family efflux transporter MFP subunit
MGCRIPQISAVPKVLLKRYTATYRHLKDRTFLMHTVIPHRLAPALLLLASFSAASSLSTVALAADQKAGLPVTIETAKAERRPATLELAGPIAAWEEMSVGARVSGLTVEEVLVRIGDTVQKDQILARLDTATVKVQIEQAQALVDQARAAHEQASDENRRAQKLKDTGALSVQSLLESATHESITKAALAQATAALHGAQLTLAQAQIVAPDLGVISARSVSLGSITQSGSELFRLIRQNRLEWRAEVTDAALSTLTPNLHARVQTPGGGEIKGQLRATSPVLNANTRMGIAYVDLSPSSALRAGMYVKGSIDQAVREVVIIPALSIVIREGKPYAVVLQGDHAHLAPVSLGARLTDTTEVLSGVSAGEQAIVRGAGFLSEGSKVQVVPAAPLAH